MPPLFSCGENWEAGKQPVGTAAPICNNHLKGNFLLDEFCKQALLEGQPCMVPTCASRCRSEVSLIQHQPIAPDAVPVCTPTAGGHHTHCNRRSPLTLPRVSVNQVESPLNLSRGQGEWQLPVVAVGGGAPTTGPKNQVSPAPTWVL